MNNPINPNSNFNPNLTTCQNILFYKSNCKTCLVFMEMAQKSNILKHFKMICVDGQDKKFKAQGLNGVPTILIPSMNKQIERGDCIKWLEDMISFNLSKCVGGLQEELVVPDVSLFMSNQNNSQPNLSNSNSNSNSNYNPNSHSHSHPHSNTNSHSHGKKHNHSHNPHNNQINLNEQINQLSSQINNLSSQLNNETKPKNQFEVNKNNTIKRNKLNPIQPPTINNFMPNSNQTNQPNPQTNQLNPQINQTNHSGPQVKQLNQLFGYLQNEMSGFSDGYAYVSVDNPLPKSFLPPDKDMEIYTAPEGKKVNRKQQDDMIKSIEFEREEQKKNFLQEITEQNNKIAMGDANSIPKWLGSNPNL